jgi:hypothetical protein
MADNYGYQGYAGYGAAPSSTADIRNRLAYAMLQRGMSSEPIRSPWQGVANLAGTLVGGLALRKQQQQEQALRQQQADMTQGVYNSLAQPGAFGAPAIQPPAAAPAPVSPPPAPAAGGGSPLIQPNLPGFGAGSKGVATASLDPSVGLPQGAPVGPGMFDSSRNMSQPLSTWPGPVAPQAGASVGNGAPDFYTAAAMHESGNRNIPNAAGGAAGGYYQFMPQTWKSVSASNPGLGLPANPMMASRDQQTAAYRALTQQNVQALQSAGIPVNDKNVFMTSFLGAGGGSKFLGAMAQNPNLPAAQLFPNEARSNPSIFFGPGGQPATLGQVYARMTNSFGSGNTTGFGAPGSQVAGPGAPSAPSGGIMSQALDYAGPGAAGPAAGAINAAAGPGQGMPQGQPANPATTPPNGQGYWRGAPNAPITMGNWGGQQPPTQAPPAPPASVASGSPAGGVLLNPPMPPPRPQDAGFQGGPIANGGGPGNSFQSTYPGSAPGYLPGDGPADWRASGGPPSQSVPPNATVGMAGRNPVTQMVAGPGAPPNPNAPPPPLPNPGNGIATPNPTGNGIGNPLAMNASNGVGFNPLSNIQAMFGLSNPSPPQPGNAPTVAAGGAPSIQDLAMMASNPYALPETRAQAQQLLQMMFSRVGPHELTEVKDPSSGITYEVDKMTGQVRGIIPTRNVPEFKLINKDNITGKETYGWVDQTTGKITPYELPGQQPGALIPMPAGGAPVGQPPQQQQQGTPGQAPNTAGTVSNGALNDPSIDNRPAVGEGALDRYAAAHPENALAVDIARGIMRGNIPYTTGNAGEKPWEVMAKQLALEATRAEGGNLDVGLYQRKQEVQNKYNDNSPGSAGGQINAANTSIGHLRDFANASAALDAAQGNSHMAVTNRVLGFLADEYGHGDLATARAGFESAKTPFAGEITKFFTGTEGDKETRDAYRTVIDENATPDQRHEAVRQLTQFLQTKMDVLSRRFSATTGSPNPYAVELQQTKDALDVLKSMYGAPANNLQPQGQQGAPAQQQPDAGGWTTINGVRIRVKQ